MDRRWMHGGTDAQKNNFALAHLYHERKWSSKFGGILRSGFGGDSVMEGRLIHKWTF